MPNATSESGIAADIYRYILQLLVQGGGAYDYIATAGNGASDIRKVLSNVNYILPAFTVVNVGTATAYLGYSSTDSTKGLPLAAGASYTFRWKNPRKCQLVVCDGGTATALVIIS